jgi:putative transposase
MRNLLIKELGRVRQEYGFALAGYVLMPIHVHLLLGEPKKATLSTALQMLKQRVSRKLRQKKRQAKKSDLQMNFLGILEELPQFWQTRFYDFNVYSRKKQNEKLDYMHANPVIRGLVKHPKDWPWSSWTFYFREKSGLAPMDGVEL